MQYFDSPLIKLIGNGCNILEVLANMLRKSLPTVISDEQGPFCWVIVAWHFKCFTCEEGGRPDPTSYIPAREQSHGNQ